MNEQIKENQKDKNTNTIGEIIKKKDIETYKKLEKMAKERQIICIKSGLKNMKKL